MVINSQMALHTTFHVAFAFIAKKDGRLYLGNRENKGTMRIFTLLRSNHYSDWYGTRIDECYFSKFSSSGHFSSFLHLAHLQQCCCQLYKIVCNIGNMESFFSAWKRLIYANSEQKYETAWDAMNDSYNITHTASMEYLWKTYIRDFHCCFVQCYTNQALHFGITVISRGKSGHIALKKKLGSSTGNLKKVIDGISLLLTNQVHNYSLAIVLAQPCYSTNLCLPIY